MNQHGIHFIQTGGTIDSYYDGERDMVIPREHTIIERYVSGLRLTGPHEFTTVCLKDSRTLTERDRSTLVTAIESSLFPKVIVTHGLFTIAETSRYLLSHLRAADKTVLITGSLMPIDGFAMSDGGFNLGFAVAEVRRMGSGIFVSARGETSTAAEIALQPEGTFYSLFSTWTDQRS